MPVPRKFAVGVNNTELLVKLALPFVALMLTMKIESPFVSKSFTSGNTVTGMFTGVELKSFTATGATFSTVVVIGGVTLLVGIGSSVGVPALAVFVMPPRTGAMTLMVKFVAVFASNVPRFVQMIWLPLVVKPAVALTKVMFAGKLSVTLKLAALEGPAFDTVMV